MSTLAIRFRVDISPAAAVGPGKIALLERIGSGGSLSQAARDLGMSYRRAWQLLESLNASFIEPVAVTARGGRRGGGATLTQFGRRLIAAYRTLEQEFQVRAQRCLRPIVSRARDRGRARVGRAPLLPRRPR